VVSIFDLLREYIESGRIKLDKTKVPHVGVVHDPCNYVRKSQMAFGEHYGWDARWIVDQCLEKRVEACDDPLNNTCCGAGGGAWAMPYDAERLAYGKMKVDQIRESGADLVIAPCHNCRDQIMKGLAGEFKKGTPGFDMGNYHETMYIWELVSKCLVYEPWSDEEIAKARELRDAQFERDGIELEEM
jgi:Fe-S oxidoreductase